ncbi:fumarylacetoacetate hydrolase family protein [Aestuariibius sp. HNIBRBA575]|uniref:fumarylacetoacetate hydrolase family protein n=1 Tax=Aestuariibius sp. HNIBRBA575 TaxID=3233343 RepID=UPI0034A32575
MAQLAFHTPSAPVLPTTQSDVYLPVRRIFCVGRNYSEHAIEMGNDPAEPPFFFTKPGDAIVRSGSEIPFPKATQNLHHEAELVVIIGKSGSDIAVENALSHVWGYAAGNDLTRRDIQSKAKEQRRPWDMAKGFDRSAVIGTAAPVSQVGHLNAGRITCHVDNELRQDSDLSRMIWPTADVISYLSGLVDLAPGDLIMTGTPAGVGPIQSGQTCDVDIDGLAPASVTFR